MKALEINKAVEGELEQSKIWGEAVFKTFTMTCGTLWPRSWGVSLGKFGGGGHNGGLVFACLHGGQCGNPLWI
jgi:hypothetical protein